MMNILECYKPKKNLLICIDSDGCAIDTMDIKHIKCFGPVMIEEWEVSEWENEILERWNEVNLYTLTRGINRFKGLSKALVEINEKYKKIEGLNEFVKWTEETKELSNESLEREIKNNTGDITCIKKALDWSIEVNKRIDSLHKSDKKPFEGVKEGIEKAKGIADIAIVSSANEKAVLEEWEDNGLLESVDIVLTQNIGSKAFCIEKLKEKGYEEVLMVGDALGDYEAAKKNDVLYYPIRVRKENECWRDFSKEAVEKFKAKSYKGEYQDKLVKMFIENLSKSNS